MRNFYLFLLAVLCSAWVGAQPAASSSSTLAGKYFRILGEGTKHIEDKLNQPEPTLAKIESQPGWGHFPNAILVPAVLYTKEHPENRWHKNKKMFDLAIRIGDLLIEEYDNGSYTSRGDNDWDTYMWLEAYRLLGKDLDGKRRNRWKEILLKEAAVPLPRLARCQDYPWYNAPYIGTSPNHYAIYASQLLLAGTIFDNPEWTALSTKVLHRFCVEEQSEDGFYGEQSREGPTTGYDYLTMAQIAMYWEFTQDPEALKALRRSTDFHKNYTYPDGTPVETINDRNRYWGVSMWGHFGFSHFPDGRRYASFLTDRFMEFSGEKMQRADIQSVGRIAQNLLYLHEGEEAPIPQDAESYAHQMKVMAGIRKTFDWTACYSGIVAPSFSANNFFLDRQGNFSVFHKKTGLIITGANSKNQPELATFIDQVDDRFLYMPISSRLQMSDEQDRLALSYNSFFGVLEAPHPSRETFRFRFLTTHKWGENKSTLNLQLALKTGEWLETASGKRILLDDKTINLSGEDIGGWIKHNGWVLFIPGDMTLQWPVFPFNPYRDAPETQISHAIGRLATEFSSMNKSFDFSIEVK